MKKSIIIALSLLLLADPSFAQELITPSFEDFEVVTPGNRAEVISPDLSYDAAIGEITLTSGVNYQANIQSQLRMKAPICAKHYVIEFDAFNGTNSAGSGGIVTGASYDQAPTSLYNDLIFEAEYDTYRDLCCLNIEPNANHISIVTRLGTIIGGNPPSPFNSYIIDALPFSIVDSNWMKTRITFDRGDVSFDIANAAGKAFREVAKAEYQENRPQYIHFSASERYGKLNLQKIKNIKIFVLEACDPVMTTAQVMAAVDPNNALGTCPIEDQYINDCMTRLSGLYEEGKVSRADYDMIMSTIETKASFCTGLNICTEEQYQKGFDAGTASVDTAAFEQKGYSAGVASVDTAAFEQKGYSAGVASVDIDGIKLASFQAGVESIDTIGLRAEGYKEGLAAGTASCPSVDGPTADNAKKNAQIRLDSECSCETAKNKGQYISCVVHILNDLRNEGFIDNTMRSTLHQESLLRNCPAVKTAASAAKYSKAVRTSKKTKKAKK